MWGERAMNWIRKQLKFCAKTTRRAWRWLSPRLVAVWGALSPRMVAAWCALKAWLVKAWRALKACLVTAWRVLRAWLLATWEQVRRATQQHGGPRRRGASMKRAHLVGMLTGALLIGIAAGMIGYRMFLEEPVRLAERATIAPATLGPPAAKAAPKGAQQKKFRIRGAEDFGSRTGDSGR
jgi:hypothetical protein